MKEDIGDLWEHHARGEWVVITTNGIVNRAGQAVMGRGVALQAAQRYPLLPRAVGEHITNCGNTVMKVEHLRLFTFPVKHHWRNRASLGLITDSCLALAELMEADEEIERVYLPRPGCGNGRLQWCDVREIVERILPGDRYIVVQPAGV